MSAVTGGTAGPAHELSIGLLGPLDVRVGTVPVQLGGRQPRALFTLLALNPGVILRMPYLVHELWDQDPPPGATNTVQVYVSRLRRALAAATGLDDAPFQPLRAHENGYVLEAGPAASDVQQFQAFVAAGHDARRRRDWTTASRRWEQALALWRGPALCDLTGPAGSARRAGLDEQRMRTWADRLDADAALGRYEAIVPELQELVREHPLDERLAGQLMRALYQVGRQAEALALYRGAARRLADELGVDPGPELRSVHAQVLRQEPVLGPDTGLRAQPATGPAGLDGLSVRNGPSVLSVLRPRTALIGRQAELEQARALLSDPEIQLVTLAGPGGTGKTRLALELALPPGDHARSRHLTAPVVPLETATDPEDLLPRICQALQAVPSWPGQPLVEVIAAALSGGPRLLVLDNLEALVHAGGGQHLARLLDAVPALTVLCTSRTALRLRGEHLLALPPLALPEPGHEHDPEHVRVSEAGQLFTERATAVMPGFELTTSNCAAVAQVCRMLDGLPLAIELAAARARLLPPSQMLARVGARLELLTGGASDLPERQRSMRAVLESSVQLLDDDETALFAMLSVFSGGWTLSDAEAVLADTAPNLNVLNGLERLVDRSLITADGSGRFGMLGVVREYAGSLLEQDVSATQRTQQAHARYYAGRAAEGIEHVGHHPDSATGGWPEQEAANLQAALEYSSRISDGQALAQLMSGLLHHWFYSGSIHQADRWIRLADATTLDPHERAQLLLSAGNLALVAGDLDRAGPMLEQAHAAALTAQVTPADAELTARTLAARSVVSRHRGTPAQALDLIGDALGAAQVAGSWALTVRLGNERGELLDETGHPEQAQPLFESFREWSRAEAAPSNLAVALVNLALLAADHGDRDRASDLVTAALDAATQGGSAPVRGDVLHGAGLVQLTLGDPEAGSRCLREAAPLMFVAGQLLTLPETVALLAVSALGLGHPRTAARLLGASDAWREPRGLAITGRRTGILVRRLRIDLTTALPDAEELNRERARGAAIPFGALPQVGQVTGWNQIWMADLRTEPGRIWVG